MNKANSKRAPGVISSLLLSLAGLTCVVFPFLGSNLVYLSFLVVFLVIPGLGIVISIAALVLGIKLRRMIKRSRNEFDETLEVLGGGKFALSVIIIATVSLLSGMFVIAGFIYFAIDVKAPPTEPVGDVAVFFFGNPDLDETAVQSVILPDSTLLTTGFYQSREPGAGFSGLFLLKTTLEGKEVWRKNYSGWNSRLTVSENNVLLAYFHTVESNPDSATLSISRLNSSGEKTDSVSHAMGGSATLAVFMPSEGSEFYLAGKHSTMESDSGDVTWVLKLNKMLETEWSNRFPESMTGIVSAAAAVRSGGLLLVGYEEDEADLDYKSRLLKLDAGGSILYQSGEKCDLASGIVDIVSNADGSFVLLANRWNSAQYLDGVLIGLSGDCEVSWSRQIDEGSYVMTTALIPWKGNRWLMTGWVPRSESVLKLTTQNIANWDTYYIATLSGTGDLEYSFNGVDEYFTAWDVTPLAEDFCVITGSGGRGEKGKFGKLIDRDIGLIFYRAPRDENRTPD